MSHSALSVAQLSGPAPKVGTVKRSHSLRIATLTSSLALALTACSGGGPQGASSAAGPGGKAAKGGTVRVLTSVAFSTSTRPAASTAA